MSKNIAHGLNKDIWRISRSEWDEHRWLLVGKPAAQYHWGRPREDEWLVAQACLYRFSHSHSRRYRAFGWNRLPRELVVSASTANRRFRAWMKTGAWPNFWHALMLTRHKGSQPMGVAFTVRPLLAELERAYALFNLHLFGNLLSAKTTIIVERSIRRPKLGYHSATGAGHLIAISHRAVQAGCEETLHTLIHEMVHLRNSVFGLPDCHPRGYHNRHFRDAALLSGLICRRSSSRGYGSTALGTRSLEAIDILAPSRGVFAWPDG